MFVHCSKCKNHREATYRELVDSFCDVCETLHCKRCGGKCPTPSPRPIIADINILSSLIEMELEKLVEQKIESIEPEVRKLVLSLLKLRSQLKEATKGLMDMGPDAADEMIEDHLKRIKEEVADEAAVEKKEN